MQTITWTVNLIAGTMATQTLALDLLTDGVQRTRPPSELAGRDGTFNLTGVGSLAAYTITLNRWIHRKDTIMATRTLGPGKLTITDDGTGRDFSAEVTKVQLVASNNTDDPINFLDGSQDTSSSTDWTLEGTIVDNFDTDNLANWCFDHAGQTLPFEGCRTTRGRPSGTVKVNISPVSIGGDVKSKNSNDFSFPATELAHSAGVRRV